MNGSTTIRNSLLTALAIFLLTPSTSVAQLAWQGTSQVATRVWLANSGEYLRRGDRLDVRFSVPQDAYVAVVHIDSDGALDFLYPSSPWRSEMVRGGRVHTLSTLGAGSRYARTDGMGYLYLIASPYPLDFSYFRGPVGSGWYWGPTGRAVHGDPFLAFDQITRIVVPQWPSALYVSDAFGYYVGGIHAYPSFACSDFGYTSGWGWTTGYGPCLRQDSFLRQYPYYYDTRRYAGDRRVYLRQYDRLDPVHGFKESPWVPASPVQTRTAVPANRNGFVPDPSGGRTPLAEPATRNAAPAAGAQGRERPVPSSAGTTTQPQPSPANSSGARGAPAPAATSRGSAGNSGGAAATPSTPVNSGRGATSTTTPATGSSRRQ